jgi:phosphoglucomutase
LKSLIDADAFKGRKLKIVVDALYGTARGYLAEILRELGCEVEVLHEHRDVYFGGTGPDPSEKGLAELIATVKKTKAHLGLACDGDADRFGVVDAGGVLYQPNDVLPLMARYLHESRGWEGIIARSCMTTHAMDAVARKYGLEIKETPVGFKYIGEIMQEAESITPSTDGEFVMGGEESGGFTMRGHVPEKDGVLACLVIAEMVAASKQSLTELTQSLHRDVGARITRRLNITATPPLVSALRDKFIHEPPTNINGLHVHRIVDIDGFKFIFQGGSWLGVRFSGTEPIVRLYLEAATNEQLDVLAKAGQSLLHTNGDEKSHGRKTHAGHR